MNVDKMRHQLARTSKAAEQHERERWLASLTPEHRARHSGPYPGLCLICLADNFSRLNEANRRHADQPRDLRLARLAKVAESTR